MQKINRGLALLAAALFLISAYSYRESTQRAERFERGQKFLSNLNPDEIAEISITKGETKTELRRSGDNFILVNANGYPAKNEAINRFLKGVLELSLEKEVGPANDSLKEELELQRGMENSTEVSLKDSSGKEMVNFLVGKSFDDSSGNYIVRTDSEEPTVFLTSSRVYLNTNSDDFLKKEILDVESSEIMAIRGNGFAIEEQEGSLKLVDVPSGKKETGKVNELKNLLSGLRFTKHYLANDSAVQGLPFDSQLEIDLKDQSGYQLAVAQKGDSHYLRIAGYHNTADKVAVTMDSDKEEVKETSEILVRADEIGQFNEFHGSWVYEISESTANKVRYRARELLENA